MRALLALLTFAVLALAVASAASAARGPYTFTDRAKFERAARADFVSLARRSLGVRYVVRSIGCTKAGTGRALCAVVASSPHEGVRDFQFALSCASDTSGPCRGKIDAWTAKP